MCPIICYTMGYMLHRATQQYKTSSSRSIDEVDSRFNSPETVIIITSFPTLKSRTDTKSNFNAVGWHVEKTLRELSKHRPVVVLAEKSGASSSKTLSSKGSASQISPSQPAQTEFNKNTLVFRVWEKGNIVSFVDILKIIKQFSLARSIYIPFEFNLFGGTVPNIALLCLLTVLRSMAKNITFEFHQVILDIGQVKQHINMRNPLKIAFFNLGLKLYYTAAGLISNSIIVFDQELKNRLASFVRKDKINVLSLALENRPLSSTRSSTRSSIHSSKCVSSISKNKARNELNLKKNELIVLVFGFINGYKGIPWIMQKFAEKKPQNMRLIIAGGKNPYLKGKAFYEKFYSSVSNYAHNKANITQTGFIPDDKVGLYLNAADVVVMPYGPLCRHRDHFP